MRTRRPSGREANPFGFLHRLARPIADMLSQPCQGIEKGALARVGIAQQSNRQGFLGDHGILLLSDGDFQKLGISLAQGEAETTNPHFYRVAENSGAHDFHFRAGHQTQRHQPMGEGWSALLWLSRWLSVQGRNSLKGIVSSRRSSPAASCLSASATLRHLHHWSDEDMVSRFLP
jgi:hypothetical protein